MKNKVFIDIYTTVWNEIFSGFPAFPIDTFRELFAKDILLPVQKECINDKTSVYIGQEYKFKRFISDEARKKRASEDDFMEPKKTITSLATLLPHVQKLAVFKGSRMINSEIIEESDDIYSSSYIFNSEHIYSSQKLLFCYNTVQSEYLLASYGSKASSFGIAVNDSASVSNSFDVGWSAKSSRCYFCSNVFDVTNCIFCFNIASKQYCIANIQYTKEEYEALKPVILKEYMAQVQSKDGFRFLSDL